MARALRGAAGLASGEFSVERFPNGELHVELRQRISGQHCLVLGTIAPPERNLLSYLLLCHTLRNEGAGRLVAILPYLAYSRHDRKESRRSLGAAWIGSLLAAAGVDEVVTLDVHSRRVARLFPIPLVTISPAAIFAEEIRRRSLLDATLVAPDRGAVGRCEAVARASGMKRRIAFLSKTRTPEGVSHGRLRGRVGRRAVLVDDMLDTGGTLISCCRELRRRGVREIHVLVTHGLFTGDRWNALRKLGVVSIGCTDTVPVRSPSKRGLTVLPAASLLVRVAMRQ
jgi:ribose-phosphate pyrophosphokinase